MKARTLGAALLFAVAVPVHAQTIAQRVAALENIVERHGDRIERLQDQVANLRERVRAQQEIVDVLQAKLACMSMTGNDVFFTGCNVHVVNGMGSTATTNALGNLIVGYNEGGQNAVRTGSHNLVVGPEHDWTSYGGFVAGRLNRIDGEHATVSGGADNSASGRLSSVSGGIDNSATGDGASVSGGTNNTAGGGGSSVSGGSTNRAQGSFSSVTGGSTNLASGVGSSVSGGNQRSAPNENNWAAGSLLENQ
jgi:hypothetical protein